MIWVDALYEKIRYDRQAKNMAVQVVIGIDKKGRREVLAIEPVHEESEPTYCKLFDNLKTRGLKDVWLVVSDAHKGLVKAIQKSFVATSRQRCKVHFMRNILAHIPAKGKAIFAEKLKQIWLQPDLDNAGTYTRMLVESYEHRYSEEIEVLESRLEDSLQFYCFEQIDSRKISSTNMRECLNRETRRRTSVVEIFPNMDSYTRLVTFYLLEYSEDWSTGRSYIRQEIIEHIQAERKRAA